MHEKLGVHNVKRNPQRFNRSSGTVKPRPSWPAGLLDLHVNRSLVLRVDGEPGTHTYTVVSCVDNSLGESTAPTITAVGSEVTSRNVTFKREDKAVVAACFIFCAVVALADLACIPASPSPIIAEIQCVRAPGCGEFLLEDHVQAASTLHVHVHVNAFARAVR